ncbi:MAG TPA: ammonia channel protein, partial [Puia sp.]
MNKITLKTALPFVILVGISTLAIFVPSVANFDNGKYNGADVAWIIVATALVFLMTPGLAFFYGGMVNRKNVISTMIKSLIAAGIVSILWIVVGYSLCFGQDVNGLIGNPFTHFMFKGVNSGLPFASMPTVPLT